MVSMIEKLLDSDHAYRADNGDVYFSVSNFPDYGKLSKKKPDELLEGARVEVGELKRDPRDFVLWKAADDTAVGWDSPWGTGAPGGILNARRCRHARWVTLLTFMVVVRI